MTSKFFRALRYKASDFIAKWIASWTFVLLYTCAMFLWIGLHLAGILHIDTVDFIKWNLFLSWFAGTQASIVMISSNRATELDRKKLIEGVELDKKSLAMDCQNAESSKQILNKIEKIYSLMDKVQQLESVVTILEKEEKEKKNGKKHGTSKR